jgi:Ser/Thr protein kinase RdoA (MazF antagonist)
MTGAAARVLDVLGVRPGRITVLKDAPPGNSSWLVQLPGGPRAVLRRYHAGASPEELAYEHAVLRHLAGAGWTVPHPVSVPVCHDMVAWELDHALKTGEYQLAAIQRQLSRTGTPPP